MSFKRRLTELTDNDFVGILLAPHVEHPNCLVLFEEDNEESIALHEVMANTASSVSSIIYYAILSRCPRLFNSSNAAKVESGSPYKGFTFRSFPCILTYHNRNPVGFYRGARNAEMISNYILNVAFQPDYYEPHDIIGGVTLDKNLEISGVNTYTNTPDRPNTVARTSLDLPPKMRGYDSKIGVVEAGTEQEKKSLNQLNSDISSSPAQVPQSAQVPQTPLSKPPQAQSQQVPQSAQVPPTPQQVPPQAQNGGSNIPVAAVPRI
jgi:hypothetical protein